MISMRPMFSFLMWEESLRHVEKPEGVPSVVRLLRSTRSIT